MKKAVLKFNDIELTSPDIHKFRGCVGNVFSDYDLIHNHDIVTGKVIYRYPLIQFKLIDRTPSIIALTEKSVNIFSEIFMKLDEIDIGGRKIAIHEKNLSIDDATFGDCDTKIKYEFASPWVGLNQKNFEKYQSAENFEKKKALLTRSLAGNILSMSKSLDYTVKNRLDIDLRLKPKTINLKGKPMIGFIGAFDVNFELPDYIGVGKSVSRGFGTTLKMEKN